MSKREQVRPMTEKKEDISEKMVGTVTADKLNLRKGPDKNSTILYVLDKGAVLDILEDRIEWLKVRYTKLAIEGFVMSDFIRRE